MRTVYTGGSFDLFHAGHVDFLRECRKIAGEGGRVVVALNSDYFVKEFKRPPVCKYDERKTVLEACRYVDEVVLNSGDKDSKPTIERVKPDFIVIGDDWAKRDYYAQMSFTPEWLAEQDISLIYVPRHRNISSTDIRGRVEK